MRLLSKACLAVTLVLTTAAGCTDSENDAAPSPSPSSPPTSSGTPTSAPPSASPSTEPPNPVSIPALIAREHTGTDLRLGDVRSRTDAYTQYAVTYRANGLTISGIMNIPTGDGPFPALVLAHGYIDPDVYTTGRGLAREQDLLARNGYIVLHTDYRNHAGSDDDPDNERSLRLGYTEDVIGAALAMRGSGRPEIDGDRIGLLGRSLGGGVVYNTLAVAPGVFDAAVAFAPVSARPEENIDFYQEGQPVVAEIEEENGTPEENPEFWREASPLTYVDRVTEPLLVHHGTEDVNALIEWSREAVSVFEEAGKDVELLTYEGEAHTFYSQWPDSMEATMDFFEEHLA
ncbi:prolyl oligopeptidase family serine peptidase [Streptomyces sp. NPDC004610]|uniref:alpha/beta hydrolase family protein n=1 Tax=unclassified Streptomyces TaxID=2593676 RepID=UPI0033B757EA